MLQIQSNRSPWYQSRWPFIIIIISLVFTAGLILGIAVAQANYPSHSVSFCKSDLYPLHLKQRSSRFYGKIAPAKTAVRYKQQRKHSTDHSVYSSYSGPPTDHQTKAWEKLLERAYARLTLPLLVRLMSTSAVMIGVSYKEMTLANENPISSIQLSSGGYLASLGTANY